MNDKIRQVHADSDSTYGARRIHAELADGGIVVSSRSARTRCQVEITSPSTSPAGTDPIQGSM